MRENSSPETACAIDEQDLPENMEWRSFRGYDEKHQIIRSDGRIMGQVDGSCHQEADGWYALALPARVTAPRLQTIEFPTIRLGRFTTLDFAKVAVEKCLRSTVVVEQ